MRYSFSIVIPAYNAEKYISGMVKSIIKQSYDNWNLIIIDDGSTDNTGAICDRYSNDKIKVFHTSNQGQMKARITGINKASGNYTLVVDADDALTINCLEKINNILNIKEYDMVMFPYVECDEGLVSSGVTSTFSDIVGEMTQTQVIRWIIKTYNHGLVNKAVKTDLIKKGASESIECRLKVNGDYALIIPILCNIHSAYFFDKPMYLYRIYGMSISHNISFQHIVDTDFVSETVSKTLKAYDLWDEVSEKLVNEAYLHMIAMMFEKIAYKNGLKLENTSLLMDKEFYRNSIKYEVRNNLSFREYIELKQIRNQRSNVNFMLKCSYVIGRIERKLRNLFNR